MRRIIVDRALGLYAVQMGAATALSFLRLMVFGALLGPASLGYWTVATTIASYGTFLQFGVLSGLNRELPVRIGRGIKDEAHLVEAALTFIALMQIVGFVFLYFSVGALHWIDVSKQKAILLAGVMTVTQPIVQTTFLILRSHRRSTEFSFLNVAHAATSLALGCLGIYLFDYVGAVVAVAASDILVALVAIRGYGVLLKWGRVNFDEIWCLMRIGLPMLAAGLLMQLQLTSDRLFLIHGRTASEIGLYQIGGTPLMLGVTVSSLVSQYLHPALLYNFGRDEKLAEVFQRSWRASMQIIVAMTLSWPIFTFSVKLLVERALPAYQSATEFMTPFYFAGICLAANSAVVFNAANRQITLTYLAAAVALLSVVANWLVSRSGGSLIVYGYVNAAVQLSSLIVMQGMSWRIAKSEGRSVSGNAP